MTPLYTPPEEGSHWYAKDGSPCHEIGGRFVGIKDARRLGLLPSVTSILKCAYKPALETWKLNQAVLAALTLPRAAGESDDDFARRVVQDSKREGIEAATFGGRLHEAIESVVGGHDLPVELADLAPHADAFRAWWKKQRWTVSAIESSFANVEEGYGGRVDLLCRVPDYALDHYVQAVVDWKTKATKPGQAIRHWDEFGVQLAAYAMGRRMHDPELVLISVVVSRNEPGRIEPYIWPREGYRYLWQTFLAARDLYYSNLGPGYSLPAPEGCRAVEWNPVAPVTNDEINDIFARIEAAEPHQGARPSARG
jgi:hypothetical protein